MKPDEPYTAEEECKIIVGRMDLEAAPEMAQVCNELQRFPAVKTSYEKNMYYYQKKIDVDMITADAVCVSDSVKSI